LRIKYLHELGLGWAVEGCSAGGVIGARDEPSTANREPADAPPHSKNRSKIRGMCLASIETVLMEATARRPGFRRNMVWCLMAREVARAIGSRRRER
jgi:hypothetical protein